MKELIGDKETISYTKCRDLNLLDTCFIVYALEHNDLLKRLSELNNLAITSFNIEELIHIEHKLNHSTRKELRNFLKDSNFIIVDVPVHPGNFEEEKDFVRAIDNNLLLKIPDASDAVLIAIAAKTHSTVYTKDKHHLFTTVLENFISQYDIQVLKTI
jgi:predicted nucleic acid-binding protein